jgi:hypothetical protein
MNGVRVLTDASGFPLEYDVGGWPIRPWITWRDYCTLAFLPRILARCIFRTSLKTAIATGESKPVKLINSALLARQDITVVEGDILQRSEEMLKKYDLVRAANVLNRSYFSDDLLVQAAVNMRSYLKGPGGLVLVIRTDALEGNMATLFELNNDGKFGVLAQFGGGSEIQPLVLGLS